MWLLRSQFVANSFRAVEAFDDAIPVPALPAEVRTSCGIVGGGGTMAVTGYARVSTTDQDLSGCTFLS
jgi:hypothetical protein